MPKFYRAIKENPPRKLTFRDHPTFRIRQASYKRLETMSPTDYRYWKEQGWPESDAVYYHDNVKANWLFDRATRFVGWMTGRQIESAMAESVSQATRGRKKMSGTVLRAIIAVIFALHGVGHVMGILPAFGIVNNGRSNQGWLKNWSSHSWLLTNTLGDPARLVARAG